MSDNKMREAFEKAFPLPSGIFWNEFGGLYDALPGCASLAEEWQAMFKGYMGALAQQPESEPERYLERLLGLYLRDGEGREQIIFQTNLLANLAYRRGMEDAQPTPQVPEGGKWIPEKPATDALYALAEVDGYHRGDRDMPGLTRWEDYYRAVYAAAPSIAEKDHD